MEVERDAEYFDYLAGLSDTHLHRVLSMWNMLLHEPNSWENPRRGNSPFLVVLRGIAKAGLPREPSEAVRAGKGGTTKRTRPAACGRVRDVKFVPTQTPPLPFFLSTVNGAFFLMLRKKAGLKRSPRTLCADKVSPFG